MNRPNRVAQPASLAGYTAAPPLAWSGWRLRIPGGPVGGQYHGFIAPDSAGWPNGHDEIFRTDGDHSQLGSDDQNLTSEPWSVLWGGTVLREGQDLSDHVFRSSAEMRPRPNASGGAHVTHAFQRRRTAGFAEAPGNYRALGVARPAVVRAPVSWVGPATIAPMHNVLVPAGATLPGPATITPMRNIFPFPGVLQSGATSTVAQPGPPSSPSPVNVVASSTPSSSPQPSPTVAAPATPTVGQPLPTAGAAWLPNTSYPAGMTVTDSNGNLQQVVTPGTSGPSAPAWATVVGTNTIDASVTWEETAAGAASAAAASWFSQSTVISGVPNLWLALGAGAAVLFFMMKGKK